MTRRILYAVYAGVAVWLGYCSYQMWGRAPVWLTIAMTSASLTPIVAGLRESEHFDEVRLLREHLEQAVRPKPPLPRRRVVLTSLEAEAFDEMVDRFNDKDEPA